jgi:hypothetical protein
MSNTIFQNFFTLRLKDKLIEEKFQANKLKNIYYFNKFFLIFLFLQSLFVTVFISTKIKMFNLSVLISVPIVTSYIVTFLLLVFFIFEIRKIPSKYYIWVHNFTYYLTLFVNVNLRIVILRILEVDTQVTVYLVIFEILFKFVWMLLALQNFVHCILLNIVTLITLWVLVTILTPQNIYSSGLINTAGYTIGLVLVQIFQYLFERKNKLAFYYNVFSKRTADWLTGVFENMNTGFITIKSGKVSFLNSYLNNFLEKIHRARINESYSSKI